MTRAAILIDGGYFLKRLPIVRDDLDCRDPVQVARSVGQLVWSHLNQLNELTNHANPHALLYRAFFYDAKPYQKKAHFPVSGKAIDYARSDEAKFRLALFELLRKRPNFAVRLGVVGREDRGWTLKLQAQRDLISGFRLASDLGDADFEPAFRQKAVDMRIGIDIASLTLKRFVDTIILVAGDADFVPAAKLARREGARVILDPLWRSVNAELFEHIDGLRSGFARRGSKKSDNQSENPADA